MAGGTNNKRLNVTAWAAVLATLALPLAAFVPALSAQRPNDPTTQRPTEAQAEFFETKVRPIFVAYCVSCHGSEAQQAGLRLDNAQGLSKGGGRGAAVVPGNPEQSLLIQAVSRRHATLKMPPTAPLKEQEVAALSEWVRAGAVWPEYKPGEARPSTLWSLRPLRRPPVPKIRNPKSEIRNPIDSFVLATLASKGMTPAPPASKRDLMRRAYFDLIGLPPTPQEVAVYLADSRPDAYERLVDRLLASPHYGERWARYWLDLVRYADTNGYERDAEKPFAWKYRDYVIRSLNEDKPFDRFVLEQLAGDELSDRTEQTLAATGFLRVGTWDDEPNDPLEYKYERLDDLVHATSTAFLAMTVRCARCHDHKFDAIPQRDYYAIGAAFWGGYLEPADRKLNGGPPTEKLPYPVLGFTEAGPVAPALKMLKNGDPRREMEEVGPGYLSMVSACRREVAPAPPNAVTTTRRLQLAKWITDPANPLTARVLANRIWQHHFGHGLVRTPNNFGVKGDPPTHPELLDWLAVELMQGERGETQGASGTRQVASGNPKSQIQNPKSWTLKRLHRLIMLSSTYRMASQHPRQEEYTRKDALNLLLWRANRRRLDADALRDSMLAVSGELNKRAGGPGFLPTVNREALEGLSRKGAEWNPSPPEEQKRRSVYMYLKRALLMPLMTVFDFGDTTAPLEQRDVTTVAPQALALMNNPLVHELSESLARRVYARAGADRSKQIDTAWQFAYGRQPSERERSAALAYLRDFRPPLVATVVESARVPTDGLKLWLRADRGVTTSPDGSLLSWEDQSGSGHHAMSAAPNGRPMLQPYAFSRKAAVRFDGKNDYLAVLGTVLTSQRFTIIAVASDRGSGSHREIFSNWNGKGGNIGTSVFLGTTGSGAIRFTDHFPGGALTNPGAPFVLSAVAGQGEVVVHQNRRELARQAAALPARNLSPPYVIGQQGTIDGEFWNGDIAEILVYDRALNETERRQVCEELLQRYNIHTPVKPVDAALASLCHALFNTNEFLYVD